VVGDATSPQSEGTKIIVHVCNDIGAWGKGFVLAISKRWSKPEQIYRSAKSPLGEIQLVQVEHDIYVANVIAQEGLRSRTHPRPLRSDQLEKCLAKVRTEAKKLSASVHMPRIGTGLAGGTWSDIEPLIQEQLCQHNIDVTVYNLPSP
jgi:O-acetyl-ADP-ribose deacetylase (regulator of RNase III)